MLGKPKTKKKLSLDPSMLGTSSLNRINKQVIKLGTLGLVFTDIKALARLAMLFYMFIIEEVRSCIFTMK